MSGKVDSIKEKEVGTGEEENQECMASSKSR